MKYSLIPLLTLMILGTVQSQQNLPVDVIQVVKDFDARLDETEKIKINPRVLAPDTTKKNYRYQVNPGVLDLKYPAPALRPVAMKAGEKIPVYPFYLKAGYGIPQQAYGKLSFDWTNNKKTKIGFDLGHLSANNKKNRAQRFYDNDIKGQVVYLTEEGMALQGEAHYSKDRYHHFGHYFQNPNTQTPEAILRHDYDLIEIGTKVYNPSVSKVGINYFAGVKLFALADNLSSKERSANLHLGVTKWIKDRHSIGIELGSDFNTLKDSATHELNNFYLLPSVGIHGKSFQISGGVRVTSSKEEINLFPVVNINLSLAGNQLMAVLGADGGLNKNTYRTLSEYNPFITSRPEIRNNEFTQYYIGLKGSNKSAEYDARVGYRQNNNLPVFILNTANFSRFGIVYRDIDLMYGTASVSFKPTKYLIVNGNVNKNFYRKIGNEPAWGLPSLEVNGSLQYQSLNQKLILKAEAFVNDGIPFKDDNGISGKSDVLMDISLGIDYRLTKHFGLFVQGNNLANTLWRRWYQYPTFGLNAIGGITLKF